jgi:hypothetical protein
VARALISGSKIFEFQLGTLAAFAISIVYFLADYFNLSARVMLDIIYAFVISIEGSNPFVLRWDPRSQRSSSNRRDC